MEKSKGDEKQRGQRREGGKKRKRQGDGERPQDGDMKKRLDALSVGYFRRVSERVNEGFTEDEEKALFAGNVLSEVKGRAVVVATDVTGSVALQRLLPLAGPAQVGELLAELGGTSGSGFRAVSCDRCSGHVMESALRQVPRWAEPESEQTTASEVDGGGEGGDCGILEAQVLSLSHAVVEDMKTFITHTHGSHVTRTLIHVLGGCLAPAQETTRSADRPRPAGDLLTDFEVPPSFPAALKLLSCALMENISVCVTDPAASTVLQSTLTVCHRKRPKLCKVLLKGIVRYLTSLSSAPGVSPLLVFVKDQASSRLIERVLLLSHKVLLRDLYKNHLQLQLVNLALHPIANFPIQRLTAAAANYKLFSKVFDELKEGLEAILAAGHMGVVVQLAESCVQREERQSELLRCLLQAFHCAEPPSRQTACIPLFLTLLTHDVYYGEQASGADAGTQRPLSGICYHGSCLVQSLAKFRDRSLLLGSIRALTPADLLTLGTDRFGSHVLQALVTTASDKGRGKILRRLQGQYVKLSCSKLGSRVLEAMWNSATVSQRQDIAQELVSSEAVLRSDQFARHVWAKLALSHFTKRHAQWHEIQADQLRRRKMFSDILE